MRYPHHDVGRLPRCIACYFSTESLRCGNQHGLDCAPSTFPISACIGKSASTLGKRWCWHMDLMRSPILSAGFQPLKVVQGICRCTFQDSPVSKSKTMYHRCSLQVCEPEHSVLQHSYLNLKGCQHPSIRVPKSFYSFHTSAAGALSKLPLCWRAISHPPSTRCTWALLPSPELTAIRCRHPCASTPSAQPGFASESGLCCAWFGGSSRRLFSPAWRI